MLPNEHQQVQQYGDLLVTHYFQWNKEKGGVQLGLQLEDC
jgi:hypothetical protein